MQAGFRDTTESFHAAVSDSKRTREHNGTPADTLATARQLTAGETFGNYRIVRCLGRGGMGVVYEADQIDTGRRVAIKVLARSLDSSEARGRFLREGRLAASINHQNSVYVFGTDEVEHVPLIAMELVRGGTLAEQVARNGQLPIARAVDVILQVIDGLEAAREKGVLHRDVKPANCFVEPDGTVKIGDFGLSISTSPRDDASLSVVTLTGQVLGTPAFASPEQLRGDELDVRGDIYSVGVTLFYLLTGRTPFQGQNFVQLLATVLEQPAPRVDKLREDCPETLASAIARCLHKLPDQRFRDYHSLRQALLPFSSTGPSPALLGLRVVANALDIAVLTLVSWTFTTLVYPGVLPINDIKIAPAGPFLIAGCLIAFAKICYYGIAESVWGATLGKAVLQLRVVDSRGNNPPLARSLTRAAVFVLWPSLFSILHGVLHAGSSIDELSRPWALTFAMLLGPGYLLLLLLLFSTARRSNGYSGVHDLIGGVKVVSRQPVAARKAWPVEESPLPQSDTLPAIGPFTVLDSLDHDSDGELLLAYDARLLRRVWIRKRTAEDPPVPENIRNIGRPGRLRWLASGIEGDSRWDAYEAPRGVPLHTAMRGMPQWDSIRYWLSDLANELRLSNVDDSVPEQLSLDRLWITNDGRLKVLDFMSHQHTEASSAESSSTTGNTTEQKCIQFVADAGERLTSGDPDHRPPLLPLSARKTLKSLGNSTSLDVASARLAGLLREMPSVTRTRRLALLLSTMLLPLMTGAALLLTSTVNTMQQIKFPELTELAGAAMLLEDLDRQPHDPHSTQQMDALRVWIAGHHRTTVETPEIWNSALAFQLFRGPGRGEVAALVRSVTPSDKELRDADLVVRPMLKKFLDEHPRALQFLPMPHSYVAVCMMALVWLELVWLPSLVTSFLFQGGLLMRIFNVVAVRANGERASSLRMLWRALIPAPIALLLTFIAVVGLERHTSIPGINAAVTWLVFGLVLLLLFVSAWGPRSISDRLAGTYLVPR